MVKVLGGAEITEVLDFTPILWNGKYFNFSVYSGEILVSLPEVLVAMFYLLQFF